MDIDLEQMMDIERDRPRGHLVVDNFFAPSALKTILAELLGLERKMKPGLVRDVGHDGQSVFFAHRRRQNKAIWIHDPSKTLRLFRDQMWSESMLPIFDGAREPLFQIIPNCWAPHLQVSSYMTGDHYDFHEDEGAGVNLTTIVFIARTPTKVHGGDLVLSYEGEETTVRFRHNRLIVFPSRTLHRVTKVRVDSTDREDARVSLQCWLAYGRPPAKVKPRAPEADRPTFLLAEEPIIAAAQAMIAEKTDQTTEDLYWGAFYLSRILSQNLRALIADQADFPIGPVRIRRGEKLEVYARARGSKVRVGFRLSGAPAHASKALSLFVDDAERILPPGATEQQAGALLRRLLKA